MLTDERDGHVFATLPSGRFSTQAIVEAFGFDPEAIVSYSAVPPIVDHARRGRTSENVALTVAPADHPRPEDVLYFLDLRPTLAHIQIRRAAAGRVDLADIHASTAVRCPLRLQIAH